MSSVEFASAHEQYKNLPILERIGILGRLTLIGFKDSLNHPETYDLEQGYQPTAEAKRRAAELLRSHGVDVFHLHPELAEGKQE